MRRARWAVVLLALCVACSAERPRTQAPAAGALPPIAERAYAAVSTRFDSGAAMDVVAFMQQYWRVAGNPGFNASIDHLRARVTAARLPVVRVEAFDNGAQGWDYSKGTLWIEGDAAPVLSKDRDRVSLAINSFPTPAGGLRARLVDVGAGAAADFGRVDVRGTVVLGDAGLGALWREAVRNRGAAGVISTQIAAYIRPDDPAKMDEAQKDVLQWGSVPYDDKLRAFGFKASWRAAQRLRAALRKDPETAVRVEIDAAFHPGPNRTLVAEIPGASKPDERIVMVAHVQEPGANDDASGCATLYALARALQEAIDRGALARPERTLTFLWVDEIRGSRQWLADHPAAAKGVRYMFSMDMTGEDTTKTGGTFLIEKQADPSAVWPRPSDPHSEWGAGDVNAASLKGSLLNDLHLAVAGRRARDTGWVVRTNPYEGGSDHTVFAGAGVPSLLNWHFTDRFYHTNQDTIDKVSAAEMANVGITVATSAYALASASPADALAVLDLLDAAGRARLALERRQGPAIVAAAADRSAAEQVEAQVVAAWIKWYGEAFESVATLSTTPPTAVLRSRIDAARAQLR
jgi:aminopeptidase YwaD